MKTREPVTKGVAKNVPVVMQMEALECGAASLAMILAYYGTWIPLEQLREDCGVSRDGSKAGNIARAAMTHGLTAKGNRLSLESIREKATFPCIIHWNFNHFVVLKGFKGDKVYINDPARGDIVISFKEFDNSYTGICLTFAPSETYQPVGKKKSMAEFVKRRLQGTGNSLAFVALTTAIASLCAMISTAFSRFFMDALLPGGNPDLEIPFLVFLSVLTAIWLGSLWLSAVFSYKFSGKFAATDNAKYFWHVMKLPMQFFSQRSASDIDQRRAASANIANMLINTLAPLAINTVMLVFYLVIMLRYSVFLTLIGVGSVAVNVAVTYWAGIKRTNLMRVLLRDQGKLISQTFTGVKSIETIKASGAENGFFHKWAGYQASALSAKAKFAKIDAYLGRLPLVITAIVNDLILILGVWLVMKGRFSEGMVLAFAGLLTQFFQPAQMLVNAGRQIQEMRSQMERIEDVMSYHEDVVFDEQETEKPVGEEKPAKVLKKLSGQLTMKGVSFGYSRLSPPLIKDFNLELPQGKSVAFVGGSGCGKSTLSKLISGLYQPWEGEILFDGKSIGDIDRYVFSGSVAVVNQDIILFEDTIANNIRMWDTSIEDFEIILAAKDAQVHEEIMKRDGGYQYKLTEGGRDFSGGQRQRMEIARVLAADPTLIIMDEATSALDAKTEFDVVRAIKERGITCIVIAHRLSTIRDCDEIIVMDKGNVVERGTHEELMAREGMYTQLIASE